MERSSVTNRAFSKNYDQRGVVIGAMCLDIYGSTQSDGRHAFKNDEYVNRSSNLFWGFLYLLVSKRHLFNLPH